MQMEASGELENIPHCSCLDLLCDQRDSLWSSVHLMLSLWPEVHWFQLRKKKWVWGHWAGDGGWRGGLTLGGFGGDVAAEERADTISVDVAPLVAFDAAHIADFNAKWLVTNFLISLGITEEQQEKAFGCKPSLLSTQNARLTSLWGRCIYAATQTCTLVHRPLSGSSKGHNEYIHHEWCMADKAHASPLRTAMKNLPLFLEKEIVMDAMR